MIMRQIIKKELNSIWNSHSLGRLCEIFDSVIRHLLQQTIGKEGILKYPVYCIQSLLSIQQSSLILEALYQRKYHIACLDDLTRSQKVVLQYNFLFANDQMFIQENEYDLQHSTCSLVKLTLNTTWKHRQLKPVIIYYKLE